MNPTAACPGEKDPVTAAPMATRYATSAVASLTRPSPSRMVVSDRWAPTVRMTAIAATGSGGETMAPSVNAAGQENSGVSACATTATATMVTSTTSVP